MLDLCASGHVPILVGGEGALERDCVQSNYLCLLRGKHASLKVNIKFVVLHQQEMRKWWISLEEQKGLTGKILQFSHIGEIEHCWTVIHTTACAPPTVSSADRVATVDV